MTDLDDRLELLRADLTSRIAAPPLASLLHPTVPARRARLGAALAALAVVAALTAGALVARASHHPNTAPAAPNPPSSMATTRHPVPAPVVTAPRTSPPAVESLSMAAADMADAHHGFALFQSCTQEVLVCQVKAIAATQDGIHWVNHNVPTAPENEGSTIDFNGAAAPGVTALGAGSVFYQAAPSGPSSGYFSADGGTTWTAVPAGVNGTVASIPAGGILQALCPPGGSDPCLTVALTVRLAANGRLTKLAHQPDIAVESANPAPLPDGSWWVTGTKAGKPALAVSRDQGRTWTSSTLPKVPGQYLYTSSVTGDDGQLWALAIGQLPDVKNGLLGIYRSTDNGEHWALIRPAKSGRQPRSALGVAIATHKQAIICDEGHPQHGWRSDDGGITFTETACPLPGFPQWSKAGYLSNDGESISLSSDGVPLDPHQAVNPGISTKTPGHQLAGRLTSSPQPTPSLREASDCLLGRPTGGYIAKIDDRGGLRAVEQGQIDGLPVGIVKESNPCPEQDRCDMQVDLIDEASFEQLPADGGG